MKIKDNLSTFQKSLIYLTALLLILGNGTIYTHLPGLSIIDAIVTFFPIVTLLLLIVSRKVLLSTERVNYLFFMNIYLIFYLLISVSNEVLSFLTLIFFNLLLIYFYLFENKDAPYLLIAYRNIIVYIAAISLVFWVGGSLLKIIPSSGSVISTWGQRDDPLVLNNYYWLYFDSREVFFLGGWLIHNVSIFTERAFAAYSFMIGLIYELFFEKKKSKLRIIVLLTAIASTTSTTGAISAIISLFFFFRQSSAKSRYRWLSRASIIPLLAVLVYYAVDYLLLSRASMGHSTESRTNDFLNGIAAWTESPIIGYGFANSKILANMGTGYSNSITQILGQGGIMLALLYVTKVSHLLKKPIK